MRRVALVVSLCMGAAPVATAQPPYPADWAVKRDPFDKTVVARWKAILAKRPHDRALLQLVALYKKHRSVVQLAQEYRRDRESWAQQVVLARIASDKLDSVRHYMRAVELDQTDLRSWIAIGDAHIKAENAQVAYERALAMNPPLPLRKAVLKKLVRRATDATARDRVYARLVELDPKHGRLWLDRADMLAAAGLHAQALASYTRAESLLAADRERQLYAITQRGHAHDKLGDAAAALAEYNRAIAKSPRGYYLKAELVERIIQIHTKANTLALLLAEYELAWPQKTRGHFEWATLAQLYAATGAQDGAIGALQQAVAKAPHELASQRRLIKLLDATGRPADALAQLEIAARAMPRDAPIQFDLAQRYWDIDKKKLFAQLDKISRTFTTQPGVHHDLADIYMKLRRLDLATREYEIVARLEPETENLSVLGEAYWTARREEAAIATWKKIARANTAKADAALGAILLEHDLIEDALVAYTRAIEREPHNPEYWRARGAVYEAGDRFTSAASDTDHAVALLGTATRDAGHAARYQLIRILLASSAGYEEDTLGDLVADWELKFALEGDLVTGYLLAEYYGRRPDSNHLQILKRMHELVPGDHGMTAELLRAYRVLKHYDEALALAKQLRAADPARKQELDAIIARVEEDRRLDPLLMQWSDGGIADPEPSILAAGEQKPATKNTAHELVRGGLRIGLGTGLRGPATSYLTAGVAVFFGGGPISLVVRADLSQREGGMKSVDALAGSIGVTARTLSTSSIALMLGAGQRFERRLSKSMSELDDAGLAVDVTLDLITRKWPAVVGLRFEQGLYQHARDTSLLFEIGVEIR
jgi:tetratricopeptide (TPR) repeat protein